ncbi:hypothetical protein [Roseovarius aestuarii]|uniref:Sulfotransferase domain protein n=1 Tax=Roseovarius aestuarii TaxID=475083 RepID=A0A1X7BP92_9RHOB|nr:hypothetical protein [Roseovarius aestuarii]SMC11415.1 hypothetical protein ROA7745_01228 [Roseovarius aestuarii]
MDEELRDFLQRNKLVIHMGAHKTATTYIQSALNAQREPLKSQGILMVLPSDLRGTGMLQGKKTQGAAAESGDGAGSKKRNLTTLLGEMAADPDTRRIVVSEEGLIGSPRNNLNRRSLYPNLTSKLANLPKPLDHPNVTFLLSLRDYGSFFSSNVTTAVRRGNIFDPEQLHASLLLMHRSWVDVLTELRAAFPSAALKIWRYEDFEALEPLIFSELAPGFEVTPSDRLFGTLSGNAIKHILDQVGPESGPEITRPVVRAAVRKYPISARNPSFSLWSEEEAAHLTFRYTLDWQAICRGYPGIVLGSA